MSSITYFSNSDLLYLLALMKTEYEKYVLAVQGKGLSTNDFTDALLTKLNGIAAGAEVNVQADWNESDSTSDAYIANKPTIPAAQIQSDWNQSDNTSADFIKNKPSIPAAQIQSDWNQSDNSSADFIKNKPSLGTAAALDVAASGNASSSQVVKGDDTRLTDARNSADVTDTYSASSHAPMSGVAVAQALATITGISFESYNSYADLPATGQAGVIYLVPNGGSAPNVKDEYFWNSATSSYELFGTTQLDLTNYVQFTDLVDMTSAEVTAAWNSVFSAS